LNRCADCPLLPKTDRTENGMQSVSYDRRVHPFGRSRPVERATRRIKSTASGKRQVVVTCNIADAISSFVAERRRKIELKWLEPGYWVMGRAV
jgi:hypothetical protein